MAPATSTIDFPDNLDSLNEGNVCIDKLQQQQHHRQDCRSNSLLISSPVVYCLLRGMSNSIGGGIGKSVRAVLSAFSNLESEEQSRL